MLRVFEGFAGYGGASFALERLKSNHPEFSYQVVGYSEVDRHATELYDLNHRGVKNYGDITRIDPKALPDFDLFTGGFPCQPFSTAGKGLGEQDTRGTLIYPALRIIGEKKPRYVLLENVRGFLSPKFKETREKIFSTLESVGYSVSYQVLNSRDYGIPQNRPRVWIFARLGGLPEGFSMKPPERYTPPLKDFLDPMVSQDLYRPKKLIETWKSGWGTDFRVEEPQCYDVKDRVVLHNNTFCALRMSAHNPYLVEPGERVRKLSVRELFRLMGVGDIALPDMPYTHLADRAGNGWDVNLVSILLEFVFSQLKDDEDLIGGIER